jgi:ATP-dependent DNA helicase DinG
VTSPDETDFEPSRPVAHRPGAVEILEAVVKKKYGDKGEVREGQLKLTKAVARAIAEGTSISACGPTGTGKSFAYLSAAVASGKTVVVATASKALQDQLCVAPETRILTSDVRYIPAVDVTVGMHLMAFEEERVGHRRHYCDSTVESVTRLTRPCYELEFDDGTRVVCSAEHQWLVGKTMEVKWMTAKQLCVTTAKRMGSKVIRLAEVWDDPSGYEHGYLAGLFDGEGCLQQRPAMNLAGGHFNSLTFSQVDNECLAEGKACLEKLGIQSSINKVNRNNAAHATCYIVRLSSRRDILRVLGQCRPRRLLAKFQPDLLGAIPAISGKSASGQRLIRKTYLGAQEVIAIKTSSRTYIAEGLASHNCNKDLPDIAAAVNFPVKFAVLKGKSNYICRQAIVEADTDQLALEVEDVQAQELGELEAEVERIKDWAFDTDTGERSELAFEPSPEAWRQVSVSSEHCPGQKRCPMGPVCFAEKAKAEAAMAQIIVVNTHLYGAHLAAQSGILPPHDVVIFDEAHEVVPAMIGALGLELGPVHVRLARKMLRQVIAGEAAGAKYAQAADALDAALEPLVGKRLKPGPSADRDLEKALVFVSRAAVEAVEQLRMVMHNPSVGKGNEHAKARATRAMKAADGLINSVQTARDADNKLVSWVEEVGKRRTLRVVTIQIASAMRRLLWEKGGTGDDRDANDRDRPVIGILTSATLPPETAVQVGLKGAPYMAVESPFNFKENSILYVPAMPDPREPGFGPASHNEIERLVRAAKGRALVLFTSYKAMNAAAEALRPRLGDEFPVLLQGELPKPLLVEKFSEHEASCLFATMSFWQGVDVPGRTNSLVIIEKLAFPRPDEPVAQAQRDAAGDGWFGMVDVPYASTMLAQAVGRLIRSQSDKGVVAVLDCRLAEKAYRHQILRLLPPMKRTRNFHDVQMFFSRILPDVEAPEPAETVAPVIPLRPVRKPVERDLAKRGAKGRDLAARPARASY